MVIGTGDDGRALIHCHAGCSVDAILDPMGMTSKDLFPARDKRTRALTVAELAAAKKLPEEFLRELGLRDTDRSVLIPYRLMDGSDASRTRLRSHRKAKSGSSWSGPKGQPIVPYGLDRLEASRIGRDLILVEGESDCWALWHHEYPALGIPGASLSNKLLAEYLREFERIFVWRESDKGGSTFVRGVALRVERLGWQGSILEIRHCDFKDPAAIHEADPKSFRTTFDSVLAAAIPLGRAGKGAIQRVLDASGVSSLGTSPRPDEVDEVLRNLAEQARDFDITRHGLLCEAVKGKLQSVGVRKVSIVDTALPVPKAPVGELDGLGLADAAPWPDSVDGAELANAVMDVFDRYLSLPKGGAVILTLWTFHTHTFNASTVSPILAITSPVMRCGKTTTIELLRALVARPLATSNVTPAVLFRVIEKYCPTLLVDEADSFLKDNNELRGILNSGHTRTAAYVLRLEGDKYEPKQFSTWCPKAIAAIGDLPSTLMDRSVVLSLRRRKPDERGARLRIGGVESECETTRRQIARWALDHMSSLTGSDPEIPEALNDRAQDNWRPLIAIADALGGDWPNRSRDAALSLHGGKAGGGGIKEKLLADIRTVLTQDESGFIASHELAKRLAGLEGRPWAEWRSGAPISATGIARLLRGFGLRPRTVRPQSEAPVKGYRLSDFQTRSSAMLLLQPKQQ